MTASTPRSFTGSKNHRAVQEAIAQETDTSVAEVEQLYEQELSQLAQQARITQYLAVLVSKRVRWKLRKH